MDRALREAGLFVGCGGAEYLDRALGGDTGGSAVRGGTGSSAIGRFGAIGQGSWGEGYK